MVKTRSQAKMAENADLLALLAEMKKSMEKGQEEMKNQIQSHVESKVGEIKDHVIIKLKLHRENRRCPKREKRDWRGKGRG
ncbi:hypothetical protein AVEN_28941-1 [Araneus ventricosus]|uniref:Uncharacterized protein n=1 Tax=Araneus ventricosus TaxID=182803 RepID=A0A4Y2ALM0_ARAVE|nr:hypothetical protein AVEN_28941-1 [Araneus ventricosus]